MTPRLRFSTAAGFAPRSALFAERNAHRATALATLAPGASVNRLIADVLDVRERRGEPPLVAGIPSCLWARACDVTSCSACANVTC